MKVTAEVKVTLAIAADKSHRAFHFVSAGTIVEKEVASERSLESTQSKLDGHAIKWTEKKIEKILTDLGLEVD